MKGLTIPTDLLLSMVIFLLLLTNAMIIYDDYYRRHISISERRGLELAALSLSDALVRTPGSPANWTEGANWAGHSGKVTEIEGLKSIGMADGWNVLDEEKVAALNGLTPYSKVQECLGFDKQDFYLRIFYADDDTDILVKGKKRAERTGVTVERAAVYDGKAAIVQVTVYEIVP